MDLLFQPILASKNGKSIFLDSQKRIHILFDNNDSPLMRVYNVCTILLLFQIPRLIFYDPQMIESPDAIFIGIIIDII